MRGGRYNLQAIPFHQLKAQAEEVGERVAHLAAILLIAICDFCGVGAEGRGKGGSNQAGGEWCGGPKVLTPG
jgi:hypothetical protein